jgi:hypothetical protein
MASRVGEEVSIYPFLFHPLAIVVFRGVGVLYGVREERRESERSFQFSKEWEDVVVVSASCKLLIHINIAVCLG